MNIIAPAFNVTSMSPTTEALVGSAMKAHVCGPKDKGGEGHKGILPSKFKGNPEKAILSRYRNAEIRRIKVARMLAQGKSRKEIALALGATKETIQHDCNLISTGAFAPEKVA